MPKEDFIPHSDAKFFTWQGDLMVYLTPRASGWGIPGTMITALNTAQSQYVIRYNAAESPETRTPTAVFMKDKARAAYIKQIREVCRVYLTNGPGITDEDRMKMGLPIHKSTRTPAPVAKTHPTCKIDTSMICWLIIHFYDEAKEKSKAKPPGQHGAEIRWMISDVPVVDVNELIHSAFDTR
ncbi:MAG: hypothetical protein LBK12_00900, partial [Odoribacteraceae bacterium]|nr:hypothetical protein [Odoribacteraceae bacterium]